MPTGYHLLNDLSSLKRQQRLRKDNLVTRGTGGGNVKVRHVPIVLEVEELNGDHLEEEEEEEEKKDVRRGSMMTAAPIQLHTNQTSQKNPPRFSLPSPSITESAKVQMNKYFT